MSFMSCRSSSSTQEFLVIGHRGAMGYEVENTIASIEKAIELGVSMVEIDVFQIQGGQLVVFHDDRVDDLTDGTGRIEQMNLEQVKTLRLSGGHRIPTLDEVLGHIDARIQLNIELKGAKTADLVHEAVMRSVNDKKWKLDQFVISSFKWDELKRMRVLNEKIQIAVLTEENALDAIQTAKELEAIAINPWYKNLTSKEVELIHQQGFKVFTYTVNEPEDIQQVREMGVDGIFCNFPDRALAAE